MLSDRELLKLAQESELISPFNQEYCEGATINLTLSPIAKQYSSDELITLGMEISDQHYKMINLETDDFVIEPTKSVLIQTNEFLKIPSNMTGRIYERYSVKSLGLLISPAHYLNPGYRGKISLLAVNTTTVPIRLVPGIKICQLGLFKLETEPLKPYEKQNPKYMDAQNVSISKLHLDEEIQEFLHSKGLNNVSDNMVRDLGDYLMSHIKKSAKNLAAIAKEELNKLD